MLGSWIPSLKCQPSPRQTLCPQSASHQISTCPSRVAFWSRRPVLRPSNSRSRSPRFADQWTEECFSWPFKVLKPSPQLYDWSTFRIATGPHLSDLSAPRCRVTVGSTFSFLWTPNLHHQQHPDEIQVASKDIQYTTIRPRGGKKGHHETPGPRGRPPIGFYLPAQVGVLLEPRGQMSPA